MKYKNLFDCLENAEGSDMEKITRNTPQLDDKQLERILNMSERKYNIKKAENINSEYSEGYDAEEGVEEYRKRPVWIRFAATAAALVLTAGLVAVTHNLLGRNRGGDMTNDAPNIAASSVVTTANKSDTDNSDAVIVSTDVTASVTGTATDVTTEATTSAAAAADNAVQTSPSNTLLPAANETPQASSVNALSEEECRSVIGYHDEEYIRYAEIENVPVSDYLDFSDTFTVTAHINHQNYVDGFEYHDSAYDIPLIYVHYVDPHFNSLNDIREFVRDYADRWNGGRCFDLDLKFGQTIVPDQVVEYDYFKTESVYAYTEYNGKIYRAVDANLTVDNMDSHDTFRASELNNLSWGHDYFTNITDTSFEDYRIQLNRWDGTYFGIYIYFYKDGNEWRSDDATSRELSDAECREFIDKESREINIG
ncbi:MAG: hypothetical protein KBA55_11735 [Ruminococcus sp.]|nr:hypothetical protein [Ruminococcus sp.]